MNEGDRTNWYLIGMGNEVDIHTVHFHAQTFIFKVGSINQSKTFIAWWEISASPPGSSLVLQLGHRALGRCWGWWMFCMYRKYKMDEILAKLLLWNLNKYHSLRAWLGRLNFLFTLGYKGRFREDIRESYACLSACSFTWWQVATGSIV